MPKTWKGARAKSKAYAQINISLTVWYDSQGYKNTRRALQNTIACNLLTLEFQNVVFLTPPPIILSIDMYRPTQTGPGPQDFFLSLNYNMYDA